MPEEIVAEAAGGAIKAIVRFFVWIFWEIFFQVFLEAIGHFTLSAFGKKDSTDGSAMFVGLIVFLIPIALIVLCFI